MIAAPAVRRGILASNCTRRTFGSAAKRVRFLRVSHPIMGQRCIEVVSHCRNKQGHVQLNVPGPDGSVHVPAHRLAFLSKYGPASIPQGWEVDHICGNRACVNRSHLQALHPTDHKRITALARGEDRREAALCHWLATECTGAELGRLFNVTTKSGCQWIRRWLADPDAA